MKKLIKLCLPVFLIFSFFPSFSLFSYANDEYHSNEQETVSLNKEDYNELYGLTSFSPLQIVPSSRTKSTVQNITYLAVFIQFSDSETMHEHHLNDPECVKNAETIFNSEENFTMDSVKGPIQVPSFKSYYEMQSYGALSITTQIFPKQNGQVSVYVDSKPMDYYLKYSENNPIGYKDSSEALQRESELINRAVTFISSQLADEGINANDIDSGHDGIVDAISFFIEADEKKTVGWGDLLWSHKTDNPNITATLLGKKIAPYNLIYAYDYMYPTGIFSMNRGTYATILHEFGHTLGYMDLYRFAPASGEPVGFYDLMGNTIGSNPQNLLTYFVSEYRDETNWHDPLPVITQTTKNITLSKADFIDPSEQRAVKIETDQNSKEYFVVEYYEKMNTYDTYTADESGAIVYRVNDNFKYNGNRDGVNDHIYVFRPNETGLGDGKGDLTKATLTSTRSTLGKGIEENSGSFDNQTIFFSNGGNSGIVIEVVKQDADSITINVLFPEIKGSGTKQNPYLIDSVSSFLYLMQQDTAGNYYKLVKDLDFSRIQNYPQIDFKGYFDGNGQTLKHISSKGCGVFNNIGEYDLQAVVENLNIEDIQVSPKDGNYAGGFANVAMNTRLKNIHIQSGSVSNISSELNELSSTGGFLGAAYNSVVIENCSSSADVDSKKNVGGFIGLNMNAVIKDCYANGHVNGSSTVGAFLGVQSISDAVYNIPQHAYYDMTKAKNIASVGGYNAYMHKLTTLPAHELGKGIVGISVPESITLKKNEKMVYTIASSPTTTLNYTVSSSDSTIVCFNNQQIQGLQAGQAFLYTDVKVGMQSMRLTTNIIVHSVEAPVIEISSIQLNTTSLSLTINESAKLTATLLPSNHTMSTALTWSSSDATIASVDNNGNIIAKKEGTALIRATTINGKSATCTVTVKPPVLSESDVLQSFGLAKKEGYVVGFPLGSDVAAIKQKLSSQQYVTLSAFTSANGAPVASGTVATGMQFTLTFNQTQYHYTIVIKGDVNGDGLIYATDYVKIKNHIMGRSQLSGAYLLAADVNNDQKIYATDYVKIKNYIMGKGEIEQK